VAVAIYGNQQQRIRRTSAISLLLSKHILRGLFFSWPLYLLGLAAFYASDPVAIWLTFLLIPAVWVSASILKSGISEDYQRLIKDMILGDDFLKEIIFPIEKQ